MPKGGAAVITGSTSRIGLGIARALAVAGCDVMLNDFGVAEAIEQLTAKSAAKIVGKCKLPITSLRTIDVVITELPVILFDDGRTALSLKRRRASALSRSLSRPRSESSDKIAAGQERNCLAKNGRHEGEEICDAEHPTAEWACERIQHTSANVFDC